MLAILAAVAVGAAVGTGGYTFIYAKGASYMTDNPTACANCHIMQSHFDGWLTSSHRNVATCNDCHTPPGLIPKYLSKAENGWHHSLAFTTGNFHYPILIKERNRSVTEESCRKCHSRLVASIEHPQHGEAGLSCIRCHGSVGHP